jgi:tRNA1Val (adenine37-N6)-methyltransferase
VANTYFQFRQFRVDQHGSAMKVCTDACIQGACAVAWLKRHSRQGEPDILDIGTGTGLLALMLKQGFPTARVDAVEIDGSAFRQAQENFNASPWAESMRIYQEDIRSFEAPHPYDFIICNPPFFDKDLKGDEARRNQAKHTVSLTYAELLRAVSRLLSPEGTCCIMLPPRQSACFQSLSQDYGFFPLDVLKVRHAPEHPVFRMITFFGRTGGPRREDEICIYGSPGQYSESFIDLLKGYYLYFP